MNRVLSSMQVAALLISASYGIGFLFGSGEMALTHGMAGSIYGLATAVGMLVLTFFAARLWRRGNAVWDLFGQAYGSSMRNGIALLSIIWMAGVLAAQIHGGVAIMRLLGLGEWFAFAVVLSGVLAASRMNLGLASKVFALFFARQWFRAAVRRALGQRRTILRPWPRILRARYQHFQCC